MASLLRSLAQERSDRQQVRDFLDWTKSLFLPLPDFMLENLKAQTEGSLQLMRDIAFIKNPDLFTIDKRAEILRLLEEFQQSLRPKSSGESDITRLSALVAEIQPVFAEIQSFRQKGKIVVAEDFAVPFWQHQAAWNHILSQFRWIERSISAYCAALEAQDERPTPSGMKEDVASLMKYLPIPENQNG